MTDEQEDVNEMEQKLVSGRQEWTLAGELLGIDLQWRSSLRIYVLLPYTTVPVTITETFSDALRLHQVLE